MSGETPSPIYHSIGYEAPQRREQSIHACLAKASNLAELDKLLPNAHDILKAYLRRLADHNLRIADLAVKRNLSFEVEEYSNEVAQAIAGRQLIQAGGKISAGQSVQYIFIDATRKNPKNRVIPLQLAPENL